jgi:hypothetical protein
MDQVLVQWNCIDCKSIFLVFAVGKFAIYMIWDCCVIYRSMISFCLDRGIYACS